MARTSIREAGRQCEYKTSCMNIITRFICSCSCSTLDLTMHFRFAHNQNHAHASRMKINTPASHLSSIVASVVTIRAIGVTNSNLHPCQKISNTLNNIVKSVRHAHDISTPPPLTNCVSTHGKAVIKDRWLCIRVCVCVV